MTLTVPPDRSSDDSARTSLARFLAVFADSKLGLGAADAEGRFVDSNEAYRQMLGYTPNELLELYLHQIVSPEEHDGLSKFRDLCEGRIGSYTTERTYRRKTGESFPVRVTAAMVRDDSDFPYVICIAEDLTELKNAEREARERENELRQALKMEAVGQLAGGVAHEFNNLLTVILAHADFLRTGNPGEGEWTGDVDEIARAAREAAQLTRQLLAFGRKQILQPRPLRLGNVIEGAVPILRLSLSEDIDLRMNVAAHLPCVSADAGQIEQILISLVANACEAMPSGGTLSISSHFTFLNNETPGQPPRMRVGFSVSDTGVGMDPAVAARVFEPFFTTKGVGRGAGLGLSTVYGIVKQSGGDIAIDTEPGRGTRVTISFPAIGASEAVVSDIPRRASAGKKERILLVEDELAVRRAAIRILTRRGYEVIAACSGPDALKQLDGDGASISLLLTDVVMPGMTGRELADIVAERHPGVGVLFMSGYTDDEILRRGLLASEVAFLTKPFTPEALVEAVAERLSRHAR